MGTRGGGLLRPRKFEQSSGQVTLNRIEVTISHFPAVTSLEGCWSSAPGAASKQQKKERLSFPSRSQPNHETKPKQKEDCNLTPATTHTHLR
jgi:hypothetical protein